MILLGKVEADAYVFLLATYSVKIGALTSLVLSLPMAVIGLGC
jgi:hypothetical protein